MKVRQYREYVCDFETTVYDGQESTEVWAAAAVEMWTENVQIFHGIDDLFKMFVATKQDAIFWFHNLKFDGEFWLYYLHYILKLKPAIYQYGDSELELKWDKPYKMPRNTYSYMISARGIWYNIEINYRGHHLIIKDSLKLLPISVERIGNSFNTKHKKLNMTYEGFRYSGCEITESEREYIANDVLVVKEAMEIFRQSGHNKSTIGSCCMAEFKETIRKNLNGALPFDFDQMSPNLYDYKLPEKYDAPTAGDYIKNSYRGGWCYLVKGCENSVYHNGLTADVNSLYPSVMHSESGNVYPIGNPTFWSGDYIPDRAKSSDYYFFVRIRTQFYLKPGYLPFIQIKRNFLYKGTECLSTSDIYDSETGNYSEYYIDRDGNKKRAIVELTLTQTDYELIKEHYDLVNCEIIDGCYFSAFSGMYDDYINKYKEIKINSKGGEREIAKLYLNNLYGREAQNEDSSFKFAVDDNGEFRFITVPEYEKKPGYIARGSAITSYARYFTITHAQMNYYGPDKPGFRYADTDSIHCDLTPEQLIGIKVHDTNFNCWKIESLWDTALFVRQKTYIEHITHRDLKPIEEPYYDIKCAGLPKNCKQLFLESMTGTHRPISKCDENERYFLYEDDGKPINRKLTDFKLGIQIPGKLRPKRIKGGIILEKTIYTMR